MSAKTNGKAATSALTFYDLLIEVSENKICLRLLALSLAPQPGVTQRYIAKNHPLTLATSR